MSTDPKNPKPPAPQKRSMFQNSVPLGDAQELGEATGWAEWNKALEERDRSFAHTAPMTAPHPPDGADRRYAKTEPAGLSAERTAVRRVRKLTADELMVEARKNNRVCPKPRRWAELFAQFGQWVPDTVAKRMAFRDHIEWCEKHDCLPQLLQSLKLLEEDDWHHMGD
jgi:hypothetical protein